MLVERPERRKRGARRFAEQVKRTVPGGGVQISEVRVPQDGDLTLLVHGGRTRTTVVGTGAEVLDRVILSSPADEVLWTEVVVDDCAIV